MKVAFISRATLYSSPGGDTKQLDLTAQNLRAMGVEVDVYLAYQQVDYSQYDLLHFFNIIRPADVIKHIRLSKKPYVVSTIFVEYGTVTQQISAAQKILKKIFSDDGLEYIKAIARAVKNGEKIVSRDYIMMGHRASIKYVASNAAMLLPNSESEYRRFEKRYGVSRPYKVVPNGINTDCANKQYPFSEKYKDAILCMGRIEARKNQLGLIRAVNNSAYRLYLHGKPSPNAMAYFEQCKNEAADNVHLEGHLDDEELFTAYSNAKVHVLPSYFETTGLSSLEAAVMGCNIVVTDMGDTRDYFKDDAWYCDPDSPASIREAIDAAFKAPYDEQFRRRILDNYTWQRAAEETLAAYKQVLKV